MPSESTLDDARAGDDGEKSDPRVVAARAKFTALLATHTTPAPSVSREAVEAAIDAYGLSRSADGYCHVKPRVDDPTRLALLALLVGAPIGETK